MMTIKAVLKELDLSPEKEKMKWMNREVKEFVSRVKNALKKRKIKAEVFVGGSFAKGTLLRSEEYDVDVFVRFDKKQKNNLSEMLEKTMLDVSKGMKLKLHRVHGSRDYFKIYRGGGLIFETIPVLKINNIKEAKNVTDLSYFHVNYIRRKIKERQRKEILIAKRFCGANKIYGAESYIQGFSGYGLECLIAYYGSFEKMIKALLKVDGRIVIDPEKHYKKKAEITIGLNESKTQGPIVLVDPTWKERNVLAALSKESFERFKQAAREFMAQPSVENFEIRETDVDRLLEIAKRDGAKLVHVSVFTDRQEGDIAGTKMRKFSNFLAGEIERYFGVMEMEFDYSGEKSAEVYFVVKSRGEMEIKGPPVKLEKHAVSFRKKHRGAYEREGKLYAGEKMALGARDYLKKLRKDKEGTMKEMGITNFVVE